MDVRRIVEKLDCMHDSDLEMLFKAIFNSNLPSSDYVLGEARALNDFKDCISRNSDLVRRDPWGKIIEVDK